MKPWPPALAAMLLLTGVALAATWGHYANARFGYGIDVPPGLVAQGEAANGDGQVFAAPTAKLTVFAANILSGDFETEVRRRENAATQSGWALTYQVSTPGGASFSGKRGARVLYARAIPLCGGSALALFQLDYSTADLAKFDPLVTRLVASFRAVMGGGCAPI